jgi:hypothetical protein
LAIAISVRFFFAGNVFVGQAFQPAGRGNANNGRLESLPHELSNIYSNDILSPLLTEWLQNYLKKRWLF